MLVWGNVRLHLTKPLREFIDANAELLTVVQLPTYAQCCWLYACVVVELM